MSKTVYVAVSTDILHGGHIALIKNAATLGDVIIGLFTDEAVVSYKRYPLLSYDERYKIFADLKEVTKIVPQKTLSFRDNLLELKPDYVVHGDNWKEGPLAPVRAEVIEIVKSYGGELVEFPYSSNPEYKKLDAYFRDQTSLPDIRRGRLKKLLNMKPTVTAMEAHSG
ncbi:MAG: adenylyltransferase/cytidyltransferase family protein, partial [Solobacterium sp.]|nr:adenylyltransferase/cytidyltransferase family protein [Solobacterium sp.]